PGHRIFFFMAELICGICSARRKHKSCGSEFLGPEAFYTTF
uniref:Uncharacterized protein n=1 Tax=Aegilops tauschii subsp. strangulata TaxID=200361 RepID=A0A453T5A5_AEGTS